MKKLYFIFSFLFPTICLYAQAWVPVGNGVNGFVNTLFVYDSVLYAGGYFSSPGNNVAQWNGTSWDSLGSGTNNEVSSIAIYNRKVYIGGWFSKAGGYSAGSIAMWNGTGLSNAGFSVEGGLVNALQGYDSLLYIGGEFDSVNHTYVPTQGLFSWDGTVVNSVSADTFYSYIYSLSVYDGNLFLGQEIYGSYDICTAYWNNSYFNCAGSYFHANGAGYQYAMSEGNRNLYLGGLFDTAGNISANNIAEWNGVRWLSLSRGINGVVYALAAYNNLLFAGGSFDSAGGVPVNNVAMWDGSAWSAVGNGFNGPVYALAIFDSTLFAGGYFSTPGEGIAKFSIPLGINNLQNKYSINIFPNPNNGNFTVECNKVTITSSEPTLEIYSILGEMIYSTKLISLNTPINLENQPTGIYFYHIFTSSNTLIATGKLVKE